jgi:hypothetical protein
MYIPFDTAPKSNYTKSIIRKHTLSLKKQETANILRTRGPSTVIREQRVKSEKQQTSTKDDTDRNIRIWPSQQNQLEVYSTRLFQN